jgi:DedD protein
MKHRLVGAAVIVALGIIAWPVIFDTTPVREISQRSEVPEGPEIERFTVAEPEPMALPPAPDSEALRAAAETTGTSPAAGVDPRPTVDAVETDDARPAPSARGDEHGLPEQWALQLGVFGDIANAREVHARADAAGFHAVLQSVPVDGEVRHRVYVEPKLDRAALEPVAREVERKLGIKGYVTRYYP